MKYRIKINNDCARKILIEVEKIPYGETISVAKLHEKISDFKIEEVLAIVTLFNREHYLTIIDKNSYDENDVLRDHKIKCLTERGYKTLDLIRDDKLWNEIKTKVDKFNEISIYTIFDIANKILSYKYNQIFNLPDNMSVSSIRW